MAIPPVTPEKIRDAFAEFDRSLRNSAEWIDWDKNKVHKFAIEHAGNVYPVKKIISLATGVSVSEFSGGEGSGQANKYINDLGFKVGPIRRRNPVWSRDELIVTLDFYLSNRISIPSHNSENLQKFCIKLKALSRQIHRVSEESFRNSNGVYMKLMNFRGLDPNHSGLGLKHGGAGDELIWNEFGERPEICARAARAIWLAVDELEQSHNEEDGEDLDSFSAEEGRVVAKLHLRRERNRDLIRRKKRSVLNKAQALACEACGFRFDLVYGERGQGFIECHHVKPIHEMKQGQKTRLDDLVLLCSNCHRMVHAAKPWLSIDDLRANLNLARLKAVR